MKKDFFVFKVLRKSQYVNDIMMLLSEMPAVKCFICLPDSSMKARRKDGFCLFANVWLNLFHLFLHAIKQKHQLFRSMLAIELIHHATVCSRFHIAIIMKLISLQWNILCFSCEKVWTNLKQSITNLWKNRGSRGFDRREKYYLWVKFHQSLSTPSQWTMQQ